MALVRLRARASERAGGVALAEQRSSSSGTPTTATLVGEWRPNDRPGRNRRFPSAESLKSLAEAEAKMGLYVEATKNLQEYVVVFDKNRR